MVFTGEEEVMQKISLNELAKYSPWPARLLGLSPWTPPSRTVEKIQQEYDQDKYAKCLMYCLEQGDAITPEDIKQFEFGKNRAEQVCVSNKNDIYLASLAETRTHYYDLFIEAMNSTIKNSGTIIELGCGYGYNLWVLKQHFSDRMFWGGEYSSNAVSVASNIFRTETDIRVRKFNFYEMEDYQFIESAQEPVVIFTAHAIEQLPSAEPFIEGLLRYRHKIKTVFNFEPIFELYDETVLGMMRQRYAQVNDYNRDLLSQIRQRAESLRIVHIEPNVWGLNPFNPTSILQWSFNCNV